MWELPDGSIRSAGTGERKLCTTEHNRKEEAPEEQNGEEEAPEEQNREEEAPEEQNREEDRVGRDCQNSNRVGARRRMMRTSRRVGKRLQLLSCSPLKNACIHEKRRQNNIRRERLAQVWRKFGSRVFFFWRKFCLKWQFRETRILINTHIYISIF